MTHAVDYKKALERIEQSAKAIYKTVHHGHPTSCEAGADDQHISMHTDLIKKSVELIRRGRPSFLGGDEDVKEAIKKFSDIHVMGQFERDYPGLAKRVKVLISALQPCAEAMAEERLIEIVVSSWGKSEYFYTSYSAAADAIRALAKSGHLKVKA